MDRRAFVSRCGCSAAAAWMLLLDEPAQGENKPADEKVPDKPEKNSKHESPMIPFNEALVCSVFGFIDSDLDEAVRQQIFEYMGRTEASIEPIRSWILQHKDRFKVLYDNVNIHHKSPYWEKLVYDTDNNTIEVIGRPVTRCVCPLSQCDTPPKSLCTHCCKSFQKTCFEMILGLPVSVRIDEAFLLGGKRCSTTIRVDGNLPPLGES